MFVHVSETSFLHILLKVRSLQLVAHSEAFHGLVSGIDVERETSL